MKYFLCLLLFSSYLDCSAVHTECTECSGEGASDCVDCRHGFANTGAGSCMGMNTPLTT